MEFNIDFFKEQCSDCSSWREDRIFQLSIKNVRNLNELVNNYILSDFSKYSTKKYYILENEILSQLLGGDYKNE